MALRAGLLATLVLGALCVISAGFIAYRLLYPPQLKPLPLTPVKQVSQSDGSAAKFKAFELPPLTEYSEIVERPLFSDSRRPAPDEPEVIAEPEPEVEEQELTLIGVMVTPNLQMALVEADEQGEVARLKIGETTNGWTLESVESNKVVLRKGESVRELPLVRNKPSPNRARRLAAMRKQQQRAMQKQLDRRASRGNLQKDKRAGANPNAPRKRNRNNNNNQGESAADSPE
jgi:general secretion pathway protein N